MNLNFPPIVMQEFFIDTNYSPGGAGHKLTDYNSSVGPISGWGALHDLAPYPNQGWLRDLDYSFPAVGSGGPARPLNFDLENLGNEGELLSIMAWLGDIHTNPPSGGILSGSVTESSFKHMKIFIGKFNFNVIGEASPPLSPEEVLDYPDPFHGPMPTDLFYESDTLYPGFSESVTPGAAGVAVAGTRTPFFQENFSTPIPYVRGSDPHNTGDLGMGIVWKLWHPAIGGPATGGRSILRIRITARRFR